MSYLKYLRKYRFNSVFLRILVLAASVLLVVNLIFGLAAYRQSLDRITKEVQRTAGEVLRRIESIVTAQVQNATMVTVGLAAAPEVTALAAEFPTMSLFEQYLATERLRCQITDLAEQNQLVESIYVYLLEPDFVVTPDATLPRRYFQDAPGLLGLARTGARSLVARVHRRYPTSGQGEVRGLSFVADFPLSRGAHLGSVVVNLDLQRVDAAIDRHRLPLNEFVLVEDEDRNPVAGEQPPGFDDGTVVTYRSDRSGWTYTSFTSSARLRSYLSSFRRLTFVLIFGAVVAGVLVAYVIALRMYRPFLRLHERFDTVALSEDGAGDEIDYIEHCLGRTLRTNQELRELIGENQLTLRSSFLRHVMADPDVGSSIESRMRLYGIDFRWEDPLALAVVSLASDGSDGAPEARRLHAIEAISRGAAECCVFEWSGEEIGVVIPGTWERNRIRSTCERILHSIPGQATCLVSGSTETVGELGRLYRSLSRILQYRFAIPHGVVFADELAVRRPHLDIELAEPKKRIVYYAAEGDADRAREAFAELLALLEEDEISARHRRFVFLELLGAVELEVLELDEELATAALERIGASYRVLYESSDPSLAPAQVEAVIEAVSEAAGRSRRAHHEKVVKQAVEFISRNYSRDISLEDVATSVGLSAPYLSKVFSRCKGEGFKEYISKLRVRKAVLLLQSTEMPIREIYRDVGFTNPSTFYRVFKRYTGAAPDTFRSRRSFGGRSARR